MPARPDLSEFTIVPANPIQVEQHARAAFVPWSRDRSWETFWGEAEKEKRAGTWAQDGAMVCWVLVRKDRVSGDIYAGCETYRRKALYRREGSDESELESAWMYGIASVVTPVHCLRMGFATRMLQLLHYMIADPATLPPFPEAWGSPPPRPIHQKPFPHVSRMPLGPRNVSLSSLHSGPRPDFLPAGIASILWSDVGYTFYEKCSIGETLPGWVADAKENTEIVWSLLPPIPGALDDWEVLDRSALRKVTPTIVSSAAASLASAPKDAPAWCIDPSSPGVLSFVPFRDVDSALEPPPGVLNVGLQLRPKSPTTTKTSDEQDVIVLLALHNTAIGPRLLITNLCNVQPGHLPSLLRALDVFGAQIGRTEGWAFGIGPDHPLAGAWKAETGRRVTIGPRADVKGHLLGVAWYGKGEGKRGTLVDTQMWGWC